MIQLQLLLMDKTIVIKPIFRICAVVFTVLTLWIGGCRVAGDNRHFKQLDIRQFGAVGDGVFDNTEAFARAVIACRDKAGSEIVVPKGIWLTGAIHLQSDVTLYIAEDAEIQFKTDPNAYLPAVFTRWEGIECYNYSPLIYAKDGQNIRICGRGTLNGQGQAWWHWEQKQDSAAERLNQMGFDNVPVHQRIFATPNDALRPSFIQFVNCSNVTIEQVTVTEGPMWTIHPVYCRDVYIDDVRILTSGPNGDGVVIDSCHDVLVEHCFFDTGDDCVVLKSGLNEDGRRVGRPCENIEVRNCRTRRGHGGIVIGSEMSGNVRNVYVHDCFFDRTQRGIRLKSMPGRGGVVENIRFENIEMGTIEREAIKINMRYGSSTVQPKTKLAPVFRDLFFKNIQCRRAETAIKIVGLPDSPVENITFDHIDITSQKGVDVIHTKNMRTQNIKIRH